MLPFTRVRPKTPQNLFDKRTTMWYDSATRSLAEKYRIVAVHGMIAHKRPYTESQVAGRPTVGHRTGSVAHRPPTSTYQVGFSAGLLGVKQS